MSCILQPYNYWLNSIAQSYHAPPINDTLFYPISHQMNSNCSIGEELLFSWKNICIVGKPIIYKSEDFCPTNLLIIKPKLISFCNLTFKIILQISLLSSEDSKCKNTSQTFFKKWNSFISLVRYCELVYFVYQSLCLCVHMRKTVFLFFNPSTKHARLVWWFYLEWPVKFFWLNKTWFRRSLFKKPKLCLSLWHVMKHSHCLFACQVQECCYRFPFISVPSSVSGEKTSSPFLK